MLKELVDEKEAERAVIGRGKFTVKEEYSDLRVDESKWFKMTKEERQAHLNNVANSPIRSLLSAARIQHLVAHLPIVLKQLLHL